MAASFQEIEESAQIALAVGIWIGERMTNAGLGCEIDDDFRINRGNERRNAVTIGEIDMLEPEMRKFLQLIEAGPLQADVIIFTHGIETYNLPTIAKQSPA